MTKQKFWNNQKYCECHLITLWNAAMYYEIPTPVRYGNEYNADCKKARAIYGGAINSDHIIKKLKLKAIRGPRNWDWAWVKANYPAEFSVFCHRGYHSVLAVDINIEKKKVLLTNYAKGRLYWVKIDNLIKMHNKCTCPIKWSINNG